MASLQAKMSSDEHSYTRDGVLYWSSNDAIVPVFVYKDACLVCPDIQARAYDAEITRKLLGFRKPNVREDVDAETNYELDAAFGVGTKVVNVFTGRRIR